MAHGNPESAVPYLSLAAVHLARGLPEAAILCYEEALKRASNDPVAANGRAMTLVRLGLGSASESAKATHSSDRART